MFRLLYQHDEDFNKIFKVKADFDWQTGRDDESVEQYVKFIASHTKKEGLLSFEPSAIECLIEYSSRIVSDQTRLSTRFGLIKDMVVEADFVTKERGGAAVTRKDVERAMEEHRLRVSLTEDRMHEFIEENDIHISVNTKKIGEINALAVYGLADMSFGAPSRVTCRTYCGKPGLVNIEREATLSGKIHNKGINILTAWIHGVFGRVNPVVLSATLCFEQNYNGIDGDSASLAELLLILSTVASIPLDQGIAVTGSLDQFGMVQPIGGLNEKIEGFFKVCASKGLTSQQGVLFPLQNQRNLMLRKNVLDAIKNGQFHLWPVATVEEAFEKITGYACGKWDPARKTFTKNSAFYEISKVLDGRQQKQDKKSKLTKSKDGDRKRKKV